METNVVSIEIALSHHQAGRLTEAQRLYESLLRIDPDDVNALHLLGVLHNAKGQYEIGMPFIRRAIELRPTMVEAHYNLGNAQLKLGEVEEAIASYTEATTLNPAHANAWLNQGDAYRVLRKMKRAEHCYLCALKYVPDNRHLYVRLGSVLRALGRLPEAVEAYQQALKIDPSAGDANYNLGNILFDSQQFDKARYFYARASLAEKPNPMAAGMMLTCDIKMCDWGSELMKEGGLRALQGELLAPFTALLISDTGADQMRFARRFADHTGSTVSSTSALQPAGDRIRVGYLSSDFHEHATAYLIAELFEVHDRSNFDVVGISYGPDDGSPMRQRLMDSFDQFLDVSEDDDAAAAQRIASAGIDILVDLKGYTKDGRHGILKHRPARVVVSYLGYPGTLGIPAVDYILADKVVLPFEDQAYFTEQIVHLPGCYQVNDSTVAAAPIQDTRLEHGLPEDAFVFCSLNGSQKITSTIFAAWMRILASVPHAVLWLFRDNDVAMKNLQRAAISHGIDPARLVFGSRLPHSQHLARYRHADLFLDTSPYNAHTTASDALRACVPVLTRRGATFASRVAASLLHAVGVPDLVAKDLADYEALAIALARERQRLEAIRERIAEGLRSGPLFNTRAFAKALESAYHHMTQRARAGQLPRQFAVRSDGIVVE